MATLSSFLFLLVLVYGVIASQNGFMTLNNVAEARVLDVVPYGEVVKASSDRLGRFEPRKKVLLRKIPKSATPPPTAHKAVHMLDPPSEPKPVPKLVPPAAPSIPPPPPLPLPLPPPPYRS